MGHQWWGQRSVSPAGGAGEGEGDQLVPEGLILWYGVWTNQSADALALWQVAHLTGVCTHRPRKPRETASEPHLQSSKTWRIMGGIISLSKGISLTNEAFFSDLGRHETKYLSRSQHTRKQVWWVDTEPYTQTHTSLLSTRPLHTRCRRAAGCETLFRSCRKAVFVKHPG